MEKEAFREKENRVEKEAFREPFSFRKRKAFTEKKTKSGKPSGKLSFF
ncbi:MAG TPA: hypothetical protein VJH95_02155 [Candidatus Nanoarchaeia archaeon]|nr:hypothetical protein [Candidatus Nanoarchaeia archaeon]